METERLLLRPWMEYDYLQLYELAKDSQVGPDCGWHPHKDIEESKQVLKNILMSEGTYAIVLKEANIVIGNISLYDSEFCENKNQREIGFWLGRDYWGKGYMSEACRFIINYAFHTLKLEKLWCGHFDYNIRSSSVQKKCGFIYYSTHENYYLPILDKYVIRILNYIDNDKK